MPANLRMGTAVAAGSAEALGWLGNAMQGAQR